MPLPLLIPLITSAISAIGGGLANRGAKTSTQPNLTPEQQQLYQSLIQQQAKLSNPDLGGYEASQTDDINHMAELQKKNLEETLGSRGITGNAVNYAKSRVDSGRFANITKLRQSLPMIRQQFGSQAMQSGTDLFRSYPTGQTNTGPSNVAGGAVGNAASTLAYFLGQGAFGKPQAPNPQPRPYQAPQLPYAGNFQ